MRKKRSRPSANTSPTPENSSQKLVVPTAFTREDGGMSDHVYKKLEVVGSSPVSMEDAVNNAVKKAAESVRNLRWFEVVETRGHIEAQKIAHWQVTVKIGFTLD